MPKGINCVFGIFLFSTFLFSDELNLIDVQKLAQEKMPEFQIGKNKLQAYKEMAANLSSFSNPKFFGEVEDFGGNGDVKGFENFKYKVGLSQGISLGATGFKEKQVKTAEYELEALKYKQLEYEIDFEIKSKFLEMWLLQRDYLRAKEYLTISKQTLESERKRVQQGSISKFWLVQLELNENSARMELEQIQNQLVLNFSNFFNPLGMATPAEIPMLKWTPVVLNLDSLSGLEVYENSIAKKISDAKIVLANKKLTLNNAEALPELEIEGGMNRAYQNGDYSFFLGLAFDLQVFDRNQGGKIEAKSEVQTELIISEQNSLKSVSHLNFILQRLLQKEKSYNRLLEIMKSSELNFAVIQNAFEIGEINLATFNDAKSSFFEMSSRMDQAVVEIELIKAEIERYLGK